MGNSNGYEQAEEHENRSHSASASSSAAENTAGKFVTDPFLEARSFIRNQALDASRLASLSWEEFLQYMSGLNQKCRDLIDSNGKYLLFAIKKGSHHSYLWKATVRICCLKMNSLSGKVESRKYLTLPQFLRLHCSLITMLNSYSPSAARKNTIEDQTSEETELKRPLSATDSATGGDGNSGSTEIPGGSAVPERSLQGLTDFKASILLDRIDSDIPGIAGDLESNCVICMERKPDVLLPCAHCYCLPCIEQWNMDHRWCPICRSRVQSTDDAWVISDYPDQADFTDYLLTLADEPK